MRKVGFFKLESTDAGNDASSGRERRDREQCIKCRFSAATPPPPTTGDVPSPDHGESQVIHVAVVAPVAANEWPQRMSLRHARSISAALRDLHTCIYLQSRLFI